MAKRNYLDMEDPLIVALDIDHPTRTKRRYETKSNKRKFDNLQIRDNRPTKMMRL